MKTKTEPKIELKGLKVAEFASEETTCHEATVWIDGVRFCTVSNQGHGGPDEFSALRPRGGWKTGEAAGKANRELDDAIHEVALRYNPKAVRMMPEGGFTFRASAPKSYDPDEWDRRLKEDPDNTTLQVFEHLVGEALTEALYLKDFKRAIKGRVLMVEDGQLFQTQKMRANAEANGYIDKVKADNPKATILNGLPLDEALALFIATITKESPTA